MCHTLKYIQIYIYTQNSTSASQIIYLFVRLDAIKNIMRLLVNK